MCFFFSGSVTLEPSVCRDSRRRLKRRRRFCLVVPVIWVDRSLFWAHGPVSLGSPHLPLPRLTLSTTLLILLTFWISFVSSPNYFVDRRRSTFICFCFRFSSFLFGLRSKRNLGSPPPALPVSSRNLVYFRSPSLTLTLPLIYVIGLPVVYRRPPQPRRRSSKLIVSPQP